MSPYPFAFFAQHAEHPGVVVPVVGSACYSFELEAQPQVQFDRALVVRPYDQCHPRAAALFERIVEQCRQHAFAAPTRRRSGESEFTIKTAPAMIDRSSDHLASRRVLDADCRTWSKLFWLEWHRQHFRHPSLDLLVLLEDKS